MQHVNRICKLCHLHRAKCSSNIADSDLTDSGANGSDRLEIDGCPTWLHDHQFNADRVPDRFRHFPQVVRLEPRNISGFMDGMAFGIAASIPEPV